MSDVIASSSLAGQALTNLVNQFARPLDFLRELVQNSLDAGSSRIEIAVGWEGEHADGVVSIHVDDFGEGMDEHIIDEQLTRLFSSTKEDDLTKIGKFGIGFTSIFAIRPDAVLVHTGRHGEYWELLFHADRTFDKVRVEKPVTGTRITLFKKMPRDEVDRLVREVRYVLGYWCEHSHTPITFEDRTQATAEPATPKAHPADPEDVFGAFEAFEAPPSAGDPRAINRPFTLEDADELLHVEEPGLEIVVGVTDSPRYAYYNGGLTLVNSVNREILGSFTARLGHLGFKVRSDQLEHTLTRDNVLQDDAWNAVMRRVVQVADRLRDKLLERAATAAAAGEDLDRWHALLVRELRAAEGRSHPYQKRLREHEIFRAHHGLLSLDAIERQERRMTRVLLHPGDGDLADALDENRVQLVRATAATRALLLAAQPPKVLGLLPQTRQLIDARTRFVLPQLIPMTELPADERRLYEAAHKLIQVATGRRARLIVGDMGGSGTVPDLVVEGPRDGRLFERKGDGWLWLPSFLRWRTLLLNRNHPHVRALVAAYLADPRVAALSLAQACLIYEGLEGESAFQALFDEATREDAA